MQWDYHFHHTIQIKSSLESSWKFQSSFDEIFLTLFYVFSVCVLMMLWILLSKDSLYSFPKFFWNYFFLEMVMDGRSKNWKNLFPNPPMDASGWIKKDHREMSNCSKVIVVPNNWAKGLYQSQMFHFFQKKNCKEKIRFQCRCWY